MAGQPSCSQRGQVAQVVERSPEKAGVGGSTPSLATTALFSMVDPISAVLWVTAVATPF